MEIGKLYKLTQSLNFDISPYKPPVHGGCSKFITLNANNILLCTNFFVNPYNDRFVIVNFLYKNKQIEKNMFHIYPNVYFMAIS